jgi:hypothetical protein
MSNYLEIVLSCGMVTKVDSEDYPFLAQFIWHPFKHGRGTVCVARPGPKVDGKNTTIYLHRLVMKAEKGDVVDHINRDPLDNRLVNLRVCSHRENMLNRKGNHGSVSGFKGVALKRNKWRARIKVYGKEKSLGSFDTKEQAALAYNKAAAEHFGAFAYLNPIAYL